LAEGKGEAMGRPWELLILDDEPLVGQRLKPALTKEGYRVEIYTDPKEAVDRLEEKNFDIVVTDIRMEELDGLEVLESVLKRSPRTKVIMITGYATLEKAHESLHKGAFDFIAKPFRIGKIREAIFKAAQTLEKE
jgi:DNA-binding NtrC family response regulator